MGNNMCKSKDLWECISSLGKIGMMLVKCNPRLIHPSNQVFISWVPYIRDISDWEANEKMVVFVSSNILCFFNMSHEARLKVGITCPVFQDTKAGTRSSMRSNDRPHNAVREEQATVLHQAYSDGPLLLHTSYIHAITSYIHKDCLHQGFRNRFQYHTKRKEKCSQGDISIAQKHSGKADITSLEKGYFTNCFHSLCKPYISIFFQSNCNLHQDLSNRFWYYQ